MKKKIIFLSSLAIFVPLIVFGQDYYGNIVGCGIATIPQFIKAVLGIIIKVGIPVGSIFIIWSGFQFLTAQGDPGKLKSAKSAFVWSCIGFGVLMGAWLFAIAFEGVITSFSGGQGQDATLNGCGNNGGNTVSSSMATQKGNPSASTPVSGQNGTVANVALVCPQNMGKEMSFSYTPPYVSLNLGNNPVKDIFPDTNSCSFGSVMETMVDYAKQEPKENSYVFMKGANINGKVVDVTLDVHQGTNAGTVLPNPADVEQLLAKYNPSQIYIMHTHPLSTVGAGSRTQPSIIDISSANNYGVFDPRVHFVVADSTGVSVYDTQNFSQWDTQRNNAQVDSMVANGTPPGLNKADQCGGTAIIENALSGQYGSASKVWAQRIMTNANEYMTSGKLNIESVSGIDVTGRVLTVAERNAKTAQSVALLKQVGIPITYYSQSNLSSCPQP